MDASHDFLANLATVLVVAGITSLIFQRLHLPVVFGYLLAGFLVGPHFPVFPFIADEASVRTLSELGVILLMFALGLEFSLRQLISIAPRAGVIAVGETGLLMLLGYLVGQAFGWSTLESIFAAAMVAISSTTIIVKAFEEQNARGEYRDLVLGILIAEDLIAILLLALLTTSAGGEISASTVFKTAAGLLVFLAAFLVIGLLIIPRLVRFVVGVGRKETIAVAMVGLCFASALLALRFGYSVALGAFIAGALAAESGVAKTVEHTIQPIRDLFAAIFFVAVGMLINPQLIAQHWPAALVLTCVVIVGKLIGVTVGAFMTGHSVRTSVQTAMSLGQIGEFSFIIAGVGLTAGATRPFLYPLAVAVSAVTTLTTPWFIKHSARAAAWVDRKLPRPLQTFAALYGSWIEGIRARPAQSRFGRPVMLLLLDLALIIALIVGVSLELPRFSSALAGFFRLNDELARSIVIGVAIFAVVPLFIGFFRTARLFSEKLADAALPARAPGAMDPAIAPRRALHTALLFGMVVAATVIVGAATQPFLPAFRAIWFIMAVVLVFAILFWRSAANLHGHARAGAEVFAAALARQLPDSEPVQPMEHMEQLMPGFGRPAAIRIANHWPSVGRTLSELDVRGTTGATALAIHREGADVILPSGRERLVAGDVIAFAGTKGAIDAARDLLSGRAGA
jgi:CPA2 family monovalent cation:H+ antiporter-2